MHAIQPRPCFSHVSTCDCPALRHDRRCCLGHDPSPCQGEPLSQDLFESTCPTSFRPSGGPSLPVVYSDSLASRTCSRQASRRRDPVRDLRETNTQTLDPLGAPITSPIIIAALLVPGPSAMTKRWSIDCLRPPCPCRLRAESYHFGTREARLARLVAAPLRNRPAHTGCPCSFTEALRNDWPAGAVSTKEALSSTHVSLAQKFTRRALTAGFPTIGASTLF